MQTSDDRTIADLMEQLIESGPDGLASAFTAMLNLAMRIEREIEQPAVCKFAFAGFIHSGFRL